MNARLLTFAGRFGSGSSFPSRRAAGIRRFRLARSCRARLVSPKRSVHHPTHEESPVDDRAAVEIRALLTLDPHHATFDQVDCHDIPTLIDYAIRFSYALGCESHSVGAARSASTIVFPLDRFRIRRWPLLVRPSDDSSRTPSKAWLSKGECTSASSIGSSGRAVLVSIASPLHVRVGVWQRRV